MRVTITLTQEQAEAVSDALDFYARLCMGKIDEIVEQARHQTIVPHGDHETERKPATMEQITQLSKAADAMKATLGFPRHGSFGIAHPHVHLSAKRSWEIKKALQKAISEARDPTPEFRGPDYDGNLLRHTSDPLPEVSVVADGARSPGIK